MPVAIEFDFREKIDKAISLDKVRPSIDAGRFVWLDVDGSDAEAARDVLQNAVRLDGEVLESCLALNPVSKYDNRNDCLHLVVVGCHLAPSGECVHDRVDVIIGESYLVTIHRDPVPFLLRVKSHYHEDFVRFAKSPGFLLYELWDALIDGYEDLAEELGGRAEEMQHRIFNRFDDTLFFDFAALGNSLLHLRKVLAPARNVLDELASRKSRFVSEATQPYLGAMIVRIERILQDIIINRDILSNALSLYMAIGDHKANKIMARLTMVTVIFLPLTFLTGIYGMNFEFQPEFKWAWGYTYFWLMAAGIVTAVVMLMRRAKLL